MKNYSYAHKSNKYPYLFLGRHNGKYIFIIKGISHSNLLFDSIQDIYQKHRDDIVFLVRQSWFHNDQIFRDSNDVIASYNLKKDNFYYLNNTEDELERARKFGFNGIYCNANCFQDERRYPLQDVPKIYKAVYVARYDKCKRHEFVPDRADVALVAIKWPDNIRDTFKNVFVNTHTFTANEVCRITNQSDYGLCLSLIEGQCRATVEYLYCGVPVISTPSKGGRDVWYTADNHVIVHTKDDIVDVLNSKRSFDRNKIREDAISLAKVFRANFYELLGKICGSKLELGSIIYSFSKGSDADFVKNIN